MSKHRREVVNLSLASRLTRRTTVKAGGLGLAAAAGLTARSVSAQQDDLPQVVADYVAAWEALDADQIADRYAEDGTSESAATGVVLEGREAIRQYLTAYIGAFSDATVETLTVFASGNQAAFEWVLAGTYTGTVPGFPPGEGQAVTVRGFSLLEFNEEAMQRTVDYNDVYGILAQLGMVPPLGPAASPAATPAG
jgi:steroid delta-isomerase-like uncharacterized protein